MPALVSLLLPIITHLFEQYGPDVLKYINEHTEKLGKK